MLQYILLGISFITLWLTIIWLNFLYSERSDNKPERLPKVSICIPAFNEESTIIKTLNSIVSLDYPDIDVVVVDDGSTDSTVKVVDGFRKRFPFVRLIKKVNGGKASAVNVGLDAAKGELFGVVDADSRLDRRSLRLLVHHFSDEKCAAVISRIRVDAPTNFLERLQRFEYIMSNMIRKVMDNINTLCITPGVLSVYRTAVIRKLGGFVRDRHNLTEDFEIALRLRDAGFDVRMEPRAVTFTKVPQTLRALWRQRIRWCRGFVYNHLSYRHLFLSKKHGFFGMFQVPINILGVLILLATVSLLTFDFFHNSLVFISRSITIPDYFLTKLTSLPTLKEFLLARDVQVTLPVLVSFGLTVCFISFAVRTFNENWKKMLGSIVAYTLIVPYFTAANWFASIYQEIFRTKRKW